jgi:hypothetical protein
VCPERAEGSVRRLSARAGGFDPTKEVLQAIVECEPVALKIKEDVEWRWLREAEKAAFWRRFGVFEDLVEPDASPGFFELHTRLVLESGQDVNGDAFDPRKRIAKPAQHPYRGDPGRTEILDLVASDERDPRQVACSIAQITAVLSPRANATVLDRIRNHMKEFGGRRLAAEDKVLEPACDEPVISTVVSNSE